MPTLLDRFQGEDGKRLLAQLLGEQLIFIGAPTLAAKLLPSTTLVGLQAGDTLIEQNAADNDVYFVLSGELSIVVNGRPIARRRPGEHVGEMALVDPAARRSASVIALEESVVAKVRESDFSRIAAGQPDLWRRVAQTLARRLHQRNHLVTERRRNPLLFIGSSSEALPLATALAESFAGDVFEVRLWTDSVFKPSKANIEALEAQIKLSDFAVLVLTPDDKVTSRGSEQLAPRDNIVFELGLFMGAVGRNRTFLLTARGTDVKIPTDLLGITPLQYVPDSRKSFADQIANVTKDLREIVLELGAV